MKRRSALATLLLAGCAVPREASLDEAAGCQYVLLGEVHDNAEHHRRRGAWLQALAQRPGLAPAIVAEHLPRGQRVAFGSDLAADLQAAGFDARAWRWPLHEPLFAAIAGAGLPLVGGNAPRELAREVARRGPAALPPELAAVLNAAPLAPAAEASLDAELVRGHCGQLGGEMLPRMRWAQRCCDAAMALTMQELAVGSITGRRPVVLLAGNGHVRRDWGVAQLLAVLQPQARLLAVGVVESRGEAPGAYDRRWLTDPVAGRADPCAGLVMPRR